jgi:FMN phosphatase YigB (HAD superfamily)
MVGDNLYADVGGAQAVGIYGIWIDWRGNGLPDNTPAIPDRIIRSILQLNPT